ncbi:MAG: hypothetical protein U1E25_07420 [Methylocystis sp.]
MLSLEELWKLRVNADVAKEAFVQGERRLADILDTKKTIEQKATSMFSAYVTIALAISGIGAAIFKDPTRSISAIAFLLPIALFVWGAVCFMSVLKGENYGTLGSSPTNWLRTGVIDSPKDGAEPARTLAQLACGFEQQINSGIAANEKKFTSIHRGMKLGLIGVASFAIALLCAFIATA